jgi:CRISPR-associated protein Csm1
MDVDDLGRIFQSGIPASSLCHLVSLSGLLRLFFEGYVPALAQHTNQKLKQNNKNPGLYLMYAGGDDLFVVGGWSHLPLLAHEIQQALGRFACGNQYVTISGGISIALAEKYPLYQAAEDAYMAETLAKDNHKNSLAFLGQAMTWGEYPLVYRRVTEWVEWLDADKIPSSFLMILRSIDAEWREWRKRESGQVSAVQPRYQNHGRLFIGPWQWHLFYQLTRAAERTKDEDLKRAVRELVHSVVGGEIVTLGLASRWAEYLTREEE